jgi:hypothetical protein
MAKILESVLGDMLAAPFNLDELVLPSPEALKRKIVCRGKSGGAHEHDEEGSVFADARPLSCLLLQASTQDQQTSKQTNAHTHVPRGSSRSSRGVSDCKGMRLALLFLGLPHPFGAAHRRRRRGG